MDPYVIGLDLGTTGLKAVGLSGDGCCFADAGDKMHYTTDEERVEFDADELYMRVTALTDKIRRAAPSDGRCGGICIVSASGNTLLTGSDGRPLGPAISWRDVRQTDEIRQVLGEFCHDEVYRLVGWPLRGGFPLAHLCWLRRHKGDLLNAAEKICMSTEYILYRLTGRWGINPSSATTFFLQDQLQRRWHRPFLDALGLSEDRLPRLMETGAVLGGLTGAAAGETGLPAGTPVILGSFDHPGAARSAGACRPGEILLSCGTSWVCFAPHESREELLELGVLCDPFLSERGLWAGMASLSGLATHLDRVLLKILPPGEDIPGAFDRLAEQAAPGAEGLLLDPLSSHENMDFSRFPAHVIARALMEGTAFRIRHRLSQMEDAGIQVRNITIVGGPSRSAPWTQIVSDVLEKPVRIVGGQRAGALGAAMVAGVAGGVFADLEDARSRLQSEEILRLPGSGVRETYEEGYRRFAERLLTP